MRIAVAAAFCAALAGCHLGQQEIANTTVRGAMPEDEFDHLRAAALLVDRGEIAPAIPHLKAHLKQHPDAPMIRAYLAELLMKVGHEGEAKTQYEQFVRDAVGQDGLAKHHLVHAHTKLMEIAAEADDSFREHYHRGVALMHLASPTADGGETWNEQTLRKAMAAIQLAIIAEPSDPRPLLPLMEIQLRLDQPTAARQTRMKLTAVLSDPIWTAAERERIREIKVMELGSALKPSLSANANPTGSSPEQYAVLERPLDHFLFAGRCVLQYEASRSSQ